MPFSRLNRTVSPRVKRLSLLQQIGADDHAAPYGGSFVSKIPFKESERFGAAVPQLC